MKKICIDPGHSINYNRGVVNDYYESNGNFALALLLKEKLIEKGFEVTLTKTELSQDPSLYTRGNMAKGHDMFLSLHSDAATNNSSVSYVTCIRSIHRPNSQKLGENLAIDIQRLMSTSGVPNIKLSQYAGAQNGVWTSLHPNIANADYYQVIREASKYSECGAIFLLECGHHTNPETCRWLDNSIKRNSLAETLCNTICEYYNIIPSEELPILTSDQENLINILTPIVQEINKNDHILASVTLAQFILESNWGTSELAEQANNSFGIKTHSGWDGELYEVETKEWNGSEYITIIAEFCKYPTTQACFDDRTYKLRESATSVYYGDVVGEADYKKACYGLSEWASAPDYPEKLIRVIETYELNKLDVPFEQDDDLEKQVHLLQEQLSTANAVISDLNTQMKEIEVKLSNVSSENLELNTLLSSIREMIDER